MDEKAKDLVRVGAPWRRGIFWSLVVIEGLVVLGIGAYMVWAASDARDIVRQLIAVVLLINSASLAWNGLRNRAHPTAAFQALRGGIGLAIGVIVVLENWANYLSDDAARYILGLGLLAYGALGLFVAIAATPANAPDAAPTVKPTTGITKRSPIRPPQKAPRSAPIPASLID